MRYRRHRRARRPAPLAAYLDLPPDCSDDVRDLARFVAMEAPALLAGLAPGEVGLVVIHPRSPACPDPAVRAGRIFAAVESRDQLEALARQIRLDASHRPGWFGCLFVGIEGGGFGYLAPLEAM